MTLASLSLLASCPAFAAPQQSAPYVPVDDTTVLEHLPSTSDPRVRQFLVLKSQLQAQPKDPRAAVALADAYLDYGRDTGDARYLGRAEAVIAPWVGKASAPGEVRVVAATILQSRHEFKAAQGILESVLARNPGNNQAWLTLSSIYLIQGDMDKARNACNHLGDADGLVMAGCTGAWATANGRARQTLDSLGAALQPQGEQSPAVMAWAHGLMADAAKYLGEDARADSEFRKALQFAPGDNFLLADYGDFLLDHGRAKEALALTRNFSQSDTSYLRQVRAEVALNLPSASKGVAAMASRFRDLEQRGDHLLYGREQARFVLELQHDPARALQIARNNWTVQRAPEDIRIYLEAALAAGKPEAAQPALDMLKQSGLQDAHIRAVAAQVSAAIKAAGTTASETTASEKTP